MSRTVVSYSGAARAGKVDDDGPNGHLTKESPSFTSGCSKMNSKVEHQYRVHLLHHDLQLSCKVR